MEGFNLNEDYEIYTPDGWKDFDGIKVTTKTFHVELPLGNGLKLVCSKDHLIKREGIFVEAYTLDDAVIVDGEIELFDPVNVGTNHEYLAEGLIHHNCEFLGSSGTLISSRVLKNLVFRESIKTMCDNLLHIFEEPQDKHSYMMMVDSSHGKELDYSAFVVIDVTQSPYNIVAAYKCNTIAFELYPNVISQTGRYYR